MSQRSFSQTNQESAQQYQQPQGQQMGGSQQYQQPQGQQMGGAQQYQQPQGQQMGGAQQYQQPQGQQMGESQQYQQPQGQQIGGAQQGRQLPQEYRQALHTVAQAVQVCGWCADQCIQTGDPHMIECIRMCEDVVELGETLLAIAPRSSKFTGDVVQTFTQAAQACASECSQHGESHCQECASVLQQATQSVQPLSSMGSQQFAR